MMPTLTEHHGILDVSAHSQDVRRHSFTFTRRRDGRKQRLGFHGLSLGNAIEAAHAQIDREGLEWRSN